MTRDYTRVPMTLREAVNIIGRERAQQIQAEVRAAHNIVERGKNKGTRFWYWPNGQAIVVYEMLMFTEKFVHPAIMAEAAGSGVGIR